MLGSVMAADPIPRIGIVTVSDRAARGEYEDRSGPAVREWLEEAIFGPWQDLARIVPDDRDRIEAALAELCDVEGCCLVVTTGGTGPAPRDVTPEATAAVCERLLPGFGEAMRAVSRSRVPTAILSRQTAGLRGGALILNLPGNPAAIRECLAAVFPAVSHCLSLTGAGEIRTRGGDPPGCGPG